MLQPNADYDGVQINGQGRATIDLGRFEQVLIVGTTNASFVRERGLSPDGEAF